MNIIHIHRPILKKGFIYFDVKIEYPDGTTIHSISITKPMIEMWYKARKFKAAIEVVLSELFTRENQEDLIRFTLKESSKLSKN